MLMSFLLAASALAVDVTSHPDGVYAIRAHFAVAAPAPAVWSVLTDYDHLDRFIPHMTSHVLQRRGADAALVDQEAPGGLHVRLAVDALPYAQIGFTDVAHQAFSDFHGSWRLTQDEPITRVDYRATARPRFLPPLVGARLLQGQVREMLEACRAEVLRRSREQG